MNSDDVLASSVTLHRLDEKNIPIGLGTGCIIDMPDCDYLFTVYHVAKKKKEKLAILVEYVEKQGPKYVVLKNFTFQSVINIKTGKKENVEFAYTRIPNKYDYFHQEISPFGNVITSKQIAKYKLQQIKTPTTNKGYAFVGHTQPEIIPNHAIHTVYMTHLDYEYKKTDGWKYIFEPPVKHPGHKYYKGCSGAPIIDDGNNIVSLLVGGNIRKNEVYGINLEKAMVGFYLETGNKI
jgi:hypothetical protein